MSRKSYAVGYRKPPARARFRKGRSGNPKGRPKGSPNVKAALERLLKTDVTLREGESVRKVSAMEALLLGLLGKGIKGHAPSARALLALIDEKFPSLEGVNPKAPAAAEDRAAVAAFLRRNGVTAEPAADTNSEEEREAWE